MEATTILNTINILLIIAIGQGLFITVLLFHKYAGLYANRFLGLLMLFFSLSLIHIYLGELEIYDQPIINLILPGVIFLIGPLHFLYTKYLIYQPRKLKKAELLHFVPIFVFITSVILVLYGWMPNWIADLFLKEHKSGIIPINWVFVLHILIYYLLSILELRWYSIRIRDVFSSIDKVRLQWLRLLTYLAIAIILKG